MSGVQFVMILGTLLMLMLFATNWDFLDLVTKTLLVLLFLTPCMPACSCLCLKVLSLTVVQDMVKEAAQYI